ncbi:MAG: cbb3-type cytochrome c oxidase subunit 3 [Bdellovibrionales bacterium]
MMKEALAFFPLKTLPLVGLVIFLVSFVGVLLWVYRKGSDSIYQQMGQMPLDLTITEAKQKGVLHE